MNSLLTSRRRLAKGVAAAGIAAGIVLVASACGGDSSSSASGSTGSAKKGGTITVLSAGDVDHIDPGQAYYSFSYEITYATQRPLLAYKPDSVNAVPDLAAKMPTFRTMVKRLTRIIGDLHCRRRCCR